jgi:hypothetical protein
MSNDSKLEILLSTKPRYRKASKKGKKIILDEFCTLCQYNRKYAIRLFNKANPSKKYSHVYSQRGRKKKYNNPMIHSILKDLWVATNLPCSRRLKAIIPLWLPHYRKQLITQEVYDQLFSISPATIDRMMAPARSKFNKKGFTTTKPGSIIKKQIPIKTNQWDEIKPGFIEADTVAHCGSSTLGPFVLTVNCVDISTTWTVQRAVWGKGERGVLNAISQIEKTLPFPILGFDCDNGSEFLNWPIYKYFTHRKRSVQFTRSRAYMKNDNAHIENKNWTHIRQYLGYQRFDQPQIIDKLNDLYANEWNLYFNFFIPSAKLIDKIRVKSKTIKKLDKPKTPFQRIIESPYIPVETKNQLRKQFRQLDPFELQKIMSQKIRDILNLVHQSTVIHLST